MASRISIENTSVHAKDLVDDLKAGELAIPPHQREFCWTAEKQKKFVDTVQEGMPTQAILIRNERGQPPSLEDGRQRITTLQRYFDDLTFDSAGRKFSELEERLKLQIVSVQCAKV